MTTREAMLGRVRSVPRWDCVVIGGGATGLGTALDAASRGYQTLLLDSHDFAKGTSSRSTKLVHGGVRYLAQGRLGLVLEALHERGLLLRNAPHLVHKLGFLVPAYSVWTEAYYGLGLRVYDLLAGKLGIGRSRTVGRDEALALAPTLEPEHLRGGVLYFDGQFDDARLAVSLLRTFLDIGGTALNYAPVEGLIKQGGRIVGVDLRELETGESLEARASVVVNATGVFVDVLRRLDEPQAPLMIMPSQGVHLVLDRSFLPGDCAVLVPRTDDGRVLFAIPWHHRVVIGTTDTPVERLSVEPRAHADEVRFLLEHAARYLSKDPSESDVLSIYAGLRPLVRAGTSTSTAKLSRDHKLLVSPSGLVTITGGKWTTYRRMAADTVTRAADVGGLARRTCATQHLKLHGWQEPPPAGEEHWALYGSDSAAVQSLCAERPEWREPLHANLPYLAGEVVWAARHECARTVDDVLSRRTRALLLDARASIEAAPCVAALLAGELGRSAEWQSQQVEQFRELARGYLLP